MEYADLESRVNDALVALYEQEGDIIQLNIGERTICGSLACLLRPRFPGHRVHVEYNRRGVEPKDLEWPAGDGTLTACYVFPDIIVHHPGHDGANLLVIEVKKTTNAYTDAHDLAKLKQLCWQLRYPHGLFLRLPAGEGAAFNGIKREWVKGPPPDDQP